MENIEIGEYIRNKDGYIGKVKKIIEPDGYMTERYYCCETTMASSYKSEIVKHSKQLIDLIEERDLCYYKLRDSDKVCKNFAVKNHLGKIQLYFYSLDQLKIIKILTHEEIEANWYKVGEEDGI